MPNKVCILSHGRSGTVYTAEVLKAVGLRVGHELPGPDGAVGGIFWKGYKRKLAEYDHVLHQVRHPLRTISSSVTWRRRTHRMYARQLGYRRALIPKDPLEAAMFSWVIYTTWADHYAEWRFRVEDMTEIFPRLYSYFGTDEQKSCPSLPLNLNTREHREYGMRDLAKTNGVLADIIHFKGVLYGYW